MRQLGKAILYIIWVGWCIVNLLYTIPEFIFGIVSKPFPGYSWVACVGIGLTFIVIDASILFSIVFTVRHRLSKNKTTSYRICPICKINRFVLVLLSLISFIIYSYLNVPQFINSIVHSTITVGIIWPISHFVTLTICLFLSTIRCLN